MSKGIHPIKQPSNSLWEAHNIRLTARDGETLLSLTNEKSTRRLTWEGRPDGDYDYLGHCVVGDSLVLFLYGNEIEDSTSYAPDDEWTEGKDVGADNDEDTEDDEDTEPLQPDDDDEDTGVDKDDFDKDLDSDEDEEEEEEEEEENSDTDTEEEEEDTEEDTVTRYPNYILRLSVDSGDSTTVNTVILYRDTDNVLGWSKEHPIQAVGVYESDLIQKVYWVDGVNRPRLINIAKPELRDGEYDATNGYTDVYKDAPFDFVQELSYDETVTVDRSTNEGGGEFPAGVIQYAFTYFFKYGQETNIFHITELMYTSHADRGGSPEETVSNTFSIKVVNPDTRFDYMRVYSILRTSVNGTPVVKRVVDIDMSDSAILNTDDDDNTYITFTDSNTSGYTVDPQQLLYIGGKDIIAQNIFVKSNTLFLGGVTYNRRDVKDVLAETLDTTVQEINHGSLFSSGLMTFAGGNRTITLTDSSADNLHINQLSENTSTFAIGEKYRFGMQFQYKTGEWSDPVFLNDMSLTRAAHPFISGNMLTIPMQTCTVAQSNSDDDNAAFVEALTDAGYVRMRGVVVLPEPHERDIVCQGVVCPTVFNSKARKSNIPFAFSSWVFRPFGTEVDRAAVEGGRSDVEGGGSDNDGLGGSVVEWRHYNPLMSGRSSSAEIQNMNIAECLSTDPDDEDKCLADYDFWYGVVGSGSGPVYGNDDPTDLSVNYLYLKYIHSGIYNNYTSTYGIWYVDNSICTLHTPELLIDDGQMGLMLEGMSNSNIGVRIVGCVPFTKTWGDIDIQLESIQADPDAKGLLPHSTFSTEGKRLVSGLFFHDATIDDYDDGETVNICQYNTSTAEKHGIRAWMVHLFQRSGSLNNDVARKNENEDTSTRTAVLKTKCVSNYTYSEDNAWIESNSNIIDLDIQETAVFDSDQVEITKLLDTETESGFDVYWGNVDYLSPSYTPFKFVCTDPGFTSMDASSVLEETTMWVEGYVHYSTRRLNGRTYTDVSGDSSDISFSVTVVSLLSANRISVTVDEDVEVTVTIENSGAFNGEETFTLFESGDTAILTYDAVDDVWTYSTDTMTLYADIGFAGNETEKSYADIVGGNVISSSESSYSSFSYYADLIELTNDAADNLSNDIGDNIHALRWPHEGVRVKYKSTPHVVFAFAYNDDGYRDFLPMLGSSDDAATETYKEDLYWLDGYDSTAMDATLLSYDTYSADRVGLEEVPDAYLWLCEVYQEEVANKFNGSLVQENTWLPAGDPVKIEEGAVVEYRWGDTWYQRFDCLKTYPSTYDDENQVVEVASFMCETRVNIDGRYDRNIGNTSNLNANPTNFNLINPVYSQRNNFFSYKIQDEDFYKVTSFPSLVFYTGQKSNGELQDTWTNLHMASSIEFDGHYGALTALVSDGEAIIGLQERAVSIVDYDNKTQLTTTDGVPVEIANNAKFSGLTLVSTTQGCQDKFAAVSTPKGVYFVDKNNASVYFINKPSQAGTYVTPLTSSSAFYFRRESDYGDWLYDSEDGGLRLFYDPKYQDLYFVPSDKGRDALCFTELLPTQGGDPGSFTSLMSYGGGVMFQLGGRFYSIADDADGDLSIYENFPVDSNEYNTIYGTVYPYSISFVSNEKNSAGDMLVPTKVFDNVEMRADLYDDGELVGGTYSISSQGGQPFDYIRVRNEYQDTGEVPLNARTFRKKFRVWRAQVPRDGTSAGDRARIRNPWALITFRNSAPGEKESVIIHDVVVNFSV